MPAHARLTAARAQIGGRAFRRARPAEMRALRDGRCLHFDSTPSGILPKKCAGTRRTAWDALFEIVGELSSDSAK